MQQCNRNFCHTKRLACVLYFQRQPFILFVWLGTLCTLCRLGDCVSLKVVENVFLLWLLPEIIDVNEHLITTNGQSQ